MTAQEQLTKVDAAIAAILDGRVQAYSVNGRTFQNLSLDQLYKMQKELQVKVAYETNGNFFSAQMRTHE